MIRRIATLGAAALVLLASAVGVRAAWLTSRQVDPPAAAWRIEVDAAAAAARLAAAIRIPTVSGEPGTGGAAQAFASLHQQLAASYPGVWGALAVEPVGDGSLLLTWPGSDPRLRPILLLAHQDVVPVEPGTEASWTHPPFGGMVADGFVWGRGALDDKGSLTAILEAVEGLLAAGFVPARTVMLAFGHDEEVGGAAGAAEIAARLAARGVEPELVLDEGMAVVEGVVPGAAGPVAMVGIAEKGYLSLDVAVEMEGAHSSMPPAETAIGVLVDGLARLGEAPFPTHVAGPTEAMLRFLAPEQGWLSRAVVANLWLTRPLVETQLAGSPAGAAILRTTMVPTLVAAGVKDNVVPARASAVVNLRVHPADDLAAAQKWVEDHLADPRLRVSRRADAVEPSPVAPVDGEAFAALQIAIGRTFPGALVAPGLVVGGTDAKHYARLTDRVYRFAPYRLGPEDLPRIHGRDERIAVEDHAAAIRFYANLLRGTAGSE